MIMRRTCLVVLISVFVSWPLDAQRAFPEWRGSNTLPPGVWKASTIAAVGEVVNIRPYGEQDVESLPWPMSPEVHKLYWCEGEFRAIAVVKGELRPRARKYLWASSLPGCKLWDDNPSLIFHRFKTRVWFLREEGGFLRPPFDGGTYRFIGFFTKWDESSRLPARRQLGTLLLTPEANGDTLEDYARYLWDAGDIACELLGKAECVLQLSALAGLGNPVLRENACNFLKGQMDESCPSK
jgi:hypothetical protein